MHREPCCCKPLCRIPPPTRTVHGSEHMPVHHSTTAPPSAGMPLFPVPAAPCGTIYHLFALLHHLPPARLSAAPPPPCKPTRRSAPAHLQAPPREAAAPCIPVLVKHPRAQLLHAHAHVAHVRAPQQRRAQLLRHMAGAHHQSGATETARPLGAHSARARQPQCALLACTAAQQTRAGGHKQPDLVPPQAHTAARREGGSALSLPRTGLGPIGP